jgi:hypothetical protein
LALAFGLARHDPKQFEGFSAGVLFVLWPIVGGVVGWDISLTVARL